ncbi:MAG TPA: zinc ribbon domain-containing protein [Caldithrix sp.]|nr:zinc ribbon domain-containing protein [Calditrichaceae bacterium]HEM48931.1 zinc ribbon domain-containing protein [Caldithrix sp.]
MPIYEFYCGHCNTIFKFFSRTINTTKVPVCPKCQSSKMERAMSTFATISKSSDSAEDDIAMPNMDESKMEQAMTLLAREAEGMDEDDPKQAANLMRKLTEMTGMEMGPGMEEAISRLERGENPDQIEAEMGDLLENEDPFILKKIAGGLAKKNKPNRDDTLYDM